MVQIFIFCILLATFASGDPIHQPRQEQCTCGQKNNQPRIVGGEDAEINEYPWRCNVVQKNAGGFCGCEIISDEWILTAAHCITPCIRIPFFPRPICVEDYNVNMGDYNRKDPSETKTEQQTVKGANVIVHAQYNPQTYANDIALIKLNTPLNFTGKLNIGPVCLPFKYTAEDFTGETVEASGWGTTSEGGSQPDILQTVNLTVISNELCNTLYDGKIGEGMICGLDDGKDTCQGDSGGSIDFPDENQNYHAIGVVSWGEGCAKKDKPGVYTRVTKYLQWIEDNTKEQFCKI